MVQKTEKTALESFASFFHQDWQLMFDNFYLGAHMYIKGLSVEDKSTLSSQLSDFLDAHKDSTNQQLEHAWVELGAYGWQQDLVITEALHDFVAMLNGVL